MARNEHSVPVEFQGLADALRDAVDGDVAFDAYSRVLYATDGSIYESQPAGVVFPTDVDDVRAAVRVAATHDVPVLARGAGTSLAGQAIGGGCVVLDCSRHLDAVIDVDPNAARAVVQPGVVLDDLDSQLAPHGLQFAPDPASSNRATVGGVIGNNSSGAHSVRYGITVDHVAALRVVLADGSVIRTRDVVVGSQEWEELVAGDDLEADLYRTVLELVEDNQDEIDARYPTLDRCVSGYNLHEVVTERDGDRVVNLSSLFVGAEGTLGVVVSATLGLVPVPDDTALATYFFYDLVDALTAVPAALDLGASAVELLDDDVVELARDSPEYRRYADPIPDEATATLLVEFDTDHPDELENAVAAATRQFVEEGDAFDHRTAFQADEQARLWKLRKAAIPLLMSLEGDAKPYPFIEDASVPPDALAEYVERFQAILDEHDTSAAFFAHAGAGTLHIRPILNLKTEAGVATMHSISNAVTDLVLEYRGAFSGEHGDGRARTEFTPKLYCDRLWSAFKELKTAFDPAWLFNPGIVVYRDGTDGPGPACMRGVGADSTTDLRYGPTYSRLEPTTTLDFSDEGGFAHLVELCNGCGACRSDADGTMCPTFRATDDERQSPRGRTNLIRAAIDGTLPPAELERERFHDAVLNRCIGCNACSSECPTGVDVAKLRVELKHQRHAESGIPRRDWVFANVARLARVGSALAPIYNAGSVYPAVSRIEGVAKRALGIAPERDLPTVRRESFRDWFEARSTERNSAHRVVLVADPYTMYSDLSVGKAAVRVLEAAGVAVELAGVDDTGRPAYSKGVLETARSNATRLLEDVLPAIDDGAAVVCVEPSDAVMIQDEYRSLFPNDPVAATVSENAYGVCEYLDRFGLIEELTFDATDDRVSYHGHCHQKAVGTAGHAAQTLAEAGFDVDVVDSGCCGMAGSYGYEAEHYDVSMTIASRLFDQLDASDGDVVVAPGVSCRTQLRAHTGAVHPAEVLVDALA